MKLTTGLAKFLNDNCLELLFTSDFSAMMDNLFSNKLITQMIVNILNMFLVKQDRFQTSLKTALDKLFASPHFGNLENEGGGLWVRALRKLGQLNNRTGSTFCTTKL